MNLEDKYMKLKALIKDSQDKIKKYRSVLNTTADELLGNNSEYEFTEHNLIIYKPSTHLSKKTT